MTEQEFLSILQQAPVATTVSHRLYHDAQGRPVMYTMEDLPGDYIEIDAESYALASFNVRVVDGKIKHMAPKISVTKLRPDPEKGTPCHPQDVCVVVAPDQAHTKWNIKQNEIS